MGVGNLTEYWRYLTARYTVYNVLWFVGVEYFFTPDEQGERARPDDRLGRSVRSLGLAPRNCPTAAAATTSATNGTTLT